MASGRRGAGSWPTLSRAPRQQPRHDDLLACDAYGKAAYTFYANGTADWQWVEPEVPQVLPADIRALYVGGLALRLLPGAAVLEGLMRRARRCG